MFASENEEGSNCENKIAFHFKIKFVVLDKERQKLMQRRNSNKENRELTGRKSLLKTTGSLQRIWKRREK